jgi:hypothetical protein
VTLTTSAALLIAMIVWQPQLNPAASYDHAYFDYPYSPVQKGGPKHQITYYLKIMGISALYGFMVRIALFSNQGYPGVNRRGAGAHSFNKKVWKLQVILSTFALVMMGLVIGGFIFWVSSVWPALDGTAKLPYT